jgi:hypothetical protein
MDFLSSSCPPHCFVWLFYQSPRALTENKRPTYPGATDTQNNKKTQTSFFVVVENVRTFKFYKKTEVGSLSYVSYTQLRGINASCIFIFLGLDD